MKKYLLTLVLFLFVLLTFPNYSHSLTYKQFYEQIRIRLYKWSSVPHDDRYYWKSAILKDFQKGIKQFRSKKERAWLWFKYGRSIYSGWDRLYEASIALERAIELGYLSQEIVFY